MTTTTEALMALAVDLALAQTDWAIKGDDDALDRLQKAKAALKSKIAEVVKDAERVPDGVIISAYTLGDRRTLNAITIQRVGQIEGPDLWAVRRNAECLAKTGEWEWEPMPSSRDDEFLARCRFDTHHAAIDAALAARSAEQKGV